MEAGHLNLGLGGVSIPVLFQGQEVVLDDIGYIDPRFEHMNMPPENPRLKKFLGESDFSLPLADGTWIASQRDSMMAGDGFVQPEPHGVIAPNDWANYADFLNVSRERVNPAEMLKKLIAQ